MQVVYPPEVCQKWLKVCFLLLGLPRACFGHADITCLSVELVEGALGESADYLIASYGTYDLKEDSVKPTAFKAAAPAQPDKSTSVLATQGKTRVGHPTL